MTTAAKTPPERKSGRPKKARPDVDTIETAPVDFKTLAAETRAKMNTSFSKGTENSPTNLASEPVLPAVGTRVLVRPHDEEGPMGEPFMSVVRAHLSPEEQEASDVEGAVLAVMGSDNGSEEHVRLDEVTLLEPEVPQELTPDLAPGTLGLHEVPLSRTTRSSCNVRSHYDSAAIEELAASLAAQGQQQNATGRWNAEGKVEIVAGESRRRAQLLRVERGEIDDSYPFLVRIGEMTDGEALAASATENMRRSSMTPLEECEAMQRLQDSGRTVEDLAALFGYKTLQPVADRILVARNLLTTPRELLDQGKLSLAQASVIARAPGAALQNSMTTSATDRHHPQSAAELSKVFTRGQMLVQTAGFNVEKSGLEVVRDLFDAFEPYFKDKAKALQAQVAHANELAERRRNTGKRAFVAVETGEWSTLGLYDHKIYEHASETDPEAGTILYVSTASGVLVEIKGVRLRKKAKVKVSEGGEVQAETPDRKISESAFLEAHQLRAQALRSSLLGHPRLGLILTVHGLIMGGTGGVSAGSAGVKLLSDTPQQNSLPETIRAGLKVLSTRLHGLANRSVDADSDVQIAHLSGGVQADDVKLYQRLDQWSDQELLETLNLLVAAVTYDWVHYNLRDKPPSPLFSLLADRVGAHVPLADSFTLTDEWLKRYPRGDLVVLAEEAGLGRALVEDCTTQKEMRARIMEHAERLHTEGFVPSLVKFPAVKA